MPRGRWTEDGRRWTPALDLPDLWFDASTSASMSTWGDVRGRLTTTLQGVAPTPSNYGNMPARNFAKAQAGNFYSGTYNAASLSGLTLVAIGRKTSSTNAGVMSFYNNASGAGDVPNDLLFGSQSTNTWLTQVDAGADGGNNVAGTGSFGLDGIVVSTFDGALSGTARLTTRMNGALPTQSYDAGYTPPTTTSASLSTQFRLANYNPGWNWEFAGLLAHAMLYRRALSTHAAQRIEGWAAKESRAFSVPGAHTFSNRPPMAGRTSARQGWERVR